ncbi:MAG: trigger factor [Bdellovibrionales bacterium]
MKSTVSKMEGLSRKLNVDLPTEKVQQAFDRVYKAIQKKANIKGFRQGKAPITALRSAYGEQVKSDVVNELVNEAYPLALEEHQLDPVGYPKISFSPIEEGKEFSFTAEIEVRPEIQLKKYEGLSITKEKLVIPDERIDTVLENIRQNQADFVTVFEDRSVTTGDVAVVNFEGFVDGQPLPNGSATDHHLEIGSSQFIEGFEDGLIGMKISESRTLNLRFPDGYHEASLSGAPVRFEVKLTGIKKKALPELNDELAKKAGEFKSLQDLKDQIRKDIEASEEQRIKEELRNRVMRALVEANPVEAPQSLVDQQKSALEEDFKGRMQQQGMNESQFEEYRQKWSQDFADSATFMVKSTFLLDTLAEKLNLRAKPSEIDEKLEEYAKQSGIELARLQEFYGRPERRSRLSFQVTEEKVVNYLLEKADIKEE